MKKTYVIPKSLMGLLSQITKRLHAGHAAVMIGAGFSKNANPNYPLWNQIGDEFYKVLNPEDSEPQGHYNDVMALADEVCSAFGRTRMEQIVVDRIGEGQFPPSDTHRLLLQLPWADVFTTNYDTLLEAAIDTAVNRRYSVIVRAEQLPNAEKPRLVKLHGSFPSTTPYILTTEDYRRYPNTHAPFVNTVRQAFLEETFCLIGFSGSDPNFLSWIGWIRDNMKGYSQPIYLFSFDHPSSTQVALLKDRGVIVVDLSLIQGVESHSDYPEALCTVFRFLRDSENKASYWTDAFSRIVPAHEEDTIGIKQLVDITTIWRKERLRYDGRLAVSSGMRFCLKRELDLWQVKSSSLTHRTHLLSAGLDFMYECIWRLNVALVPLRGNFLAMAISILKGWNGISRRVTYGRRRKERASLKNVKDKLAFVALNVMRAFREQGHDTEWEKLNSIMEKSDRQFLPEMIQKLRYEQALHAHSTFDSLHLKKVLDKWDLDESQPVGFVYKAVFHYERGEYDDARRLLLKGLSVVRQMEPLLGDIQGTSCLILESSIMRTLRCLKWQSQKDIPGKEVASREHNDEDYYDRQLLDRKNALKGLGYDVDYDLSQFSLDLVNRESDGYSKKKSNSFDIDRDGNTESWSYPLGNSFAVLRYLEEIAVPYPTIGKELLVKALGDGRLQLTGALISVVCRNGNKQILDSVLSRDGINDIPHKDAAELIARYLSPLNDQFYRSALGAKKVLQSDIVNALVQVVSRLCSKLIDRSVRIKVFELLQCIYENRRNVDIGCPLRELTGRAIATTPVEQLQDVVSILLEFQFDDSDNNAHSASMFINPFEFLSERSEDLRTAKVGVTNAQFKLLCERISAKGKSRGAKEWHMKKAILLACYGCLNDTQNRTIGKMVWSNSSLPMCSGLYENVILSLRPLSQARLRTWFSKTLRDSELFEESKAIYKINDTAIVNGHSRLLSNVLAAHNVNPSLIGKDELRDIWGKINEYWSEDRMKLCAEEKTNTDLPYFGPDISTEFRRRYSSCSNIVANVIVPIAEKLRMGVVLGQVKDWVKRLSESGVCSLAVQASVCRNGSLMDVRHLIDDAESNLCNFVEDNRLDARRALVMILKRGKQTVRRAVVDKLIGFGLSCEVARFGDFVNSINAGHLSKQELTKVWSRISPRLCQLLRVLDYKNDNGISVKEKVSARVKVVRFMRNMINGGLDLRTDNVLNAWEESISADTEHNEVINAYCRELQS